MQQGRGWENGEPVQEATTPSLWRHELGLKTKVKPRVSDQSWKLIWRGYWWRRRSLKCLWSLGLGWLDEWRYHLQALEIKEKRRLGAGEERSSLRRVEFEVPLSGTTGEVPSRLLDVQVWNSEARRGLEIEAENLSSSFPLLDPSLGDSKQESKQYMF